MKSDFNIPLFKYLVISCALIALSSCQGIFNDIYDDAPNPEMPNDKSILYIDASKWDEWHYLDFATLISNLESNSDYSPVNAWNTFKIDVPSGNKEYVKPENHKSGIYTYWYDVYGAGLSNFRFEYFQSIPLQSEPENWSIAIHRNNIRTNGGAAAETSYNSIEELPDDESFLSNLDYHEDEWNETDVWTVQTQMLSGLIGNQGICINTTLGRWLKTSIPPIPPAFSLNPHVFIIKFSDGTYCALQLVDYMNKEGVKCCLTIKYKYPL